MQSRIFKIGILGCGVISKTYIADIQKFFPALNIIACADVLPEAAKSTADEFNIEKVYTPEQLLSDEDIEIVINLTPPQFHLELNKRIIKAGKHLFSEKPFAPDLNSAKEILALAKEKNLYVGGAPDTFLSSGLQSVRYYLDNGLIGKPFMVTANMTNFGPETWHPNPTPFYQPESGALFDMGPYYISAIVSLFGSVQRIAAFGTKPNETRHLYVGKNAGQDITSNTTTTHTAILSLKNGVIVNLNISYDIYKSNLPMFEIYGDCGTLTYPDPNFGGGTPKVYRKEQFTDCIFQNTEEAIKRHNTFYELPELFPRVKDYSRGIGVMDLAASIECGRENRAGGQLLSHVTEVLKGIEYSAKNGTFYEVKTECERPEKLCPGNYIDRV